MKVVPKILFILILSALSVFGTLAAQEDVQTPSQKMEKAVEKLSKTPATIGKSLDALTEAAKAKLQRAFQDIPSDQSKPAPSDLSVPPRKVEQPTAAPFSSGGKRDPFRQITFRARTDSRLRENLSPLERVEWSQINLVGIIWDSKEPKAMVEVAEPGDNSRGYIVKIGTLIGKSEGRVMAITQNKLIVEESYTDLYGAKKTRAVSKTLSTEQ